MTSKVDEFHAALETSVGVTNVSTADLWKRHLASEGYTTGSVLDRMKKYAVANSVSITDLMDLVIAGGGGGGATAPGAPTIGTATAGDTQASITFTAPASDGGSAITGYTMTSSPGGLTATGASSPLVVTGLTNGVAYTFTVTATNAVGTSSASAASNSVTPSVPNLLTNGTFDTDTNWTKAGAWTAITGGEAVAVASGSASNLDQAFAFTPGTTYRITWEQRMTGGAMVVRFNGGTIVSSASIGNGENDNVYRTKTVDMVAATGNNIFSMRASSTFTGAIDNVVMVAL